MHTCNFTCIPQRMHLNETVIGSRNDTQHEGGRDCDSLLKSRKSNRQVETKHLQTREWREGTKEYEERAPSFIPHACPTGTRGAERRRAVLTTAKSGVHSHGHADACGTYPRFHVNKTIPTLLIFRFSFWVGAHPSGCATRRPIGEAVTAATGALSASFWRHLSCV